MSELLWQAPACSIGEVARAVVHDHKGLPSNQSMVDAAKVDHSHSERNAHRLFNRYGLALKVPISHLTFAHGNGKDTIDIPSLRMRDFLRLLLDKYPKVLFGGQQPGPASQRLCATFWQRYQSYHPQHVLFDKVKKEDWGSYVPLFLHGDKGRTLQKSPIFVLAFETPWGLPPDMLARCSYDNRQMQRKQFHDGRLSWTCSARVRFSGKRTHDDMTGCTMECPGHLDNSSANSHQRHNSKGHSYLSRFLVAAITSKTYKRNSNVLPGILQKTAAELEDLFTVGLHSKELGGQIKFALVGVKGDAEFHWEAGNFTRSYHHTGTKNEAMICPLCEAGGEGVSFTDAAPHPAWEATIGASDPWQELPPLNHAPFAESYRAFVYKFDPFHVLKFGVYRDAVASTLIRLALMLYFDFQECDSKAIDQRLERAFSLFKMWALAAGKNPAIKAFTKANMNFERYKSYPWCNAKGSDITLLLMWLEFVLPFFIAEPKAEGDLKVLKAMYQTIQAGLSYIGVMHSHGVWLPRCCAKFQLETGFRFLRGYLFLADHCMQNHVAGYRLRPKLHYLHHLLHDSQRQLENPAVGFIFSSSALLCETNEDFIGRLARVSRRVAAKTAGMRTTQRYLVKVRCLLERLGG